MTLVFLSTKTLMVVRSCEFVVVQTGSGGFLDRSDGFPGGVVEIVRRRDREAGGREQLAPLLDVRALQAHDDRDLEPDFLDRRDDALGDEIATDDAAEDVDE